MARGAVGSCVRHPLCAEQLDWKHEKSGRASSETHGRARPYSKGQKSCACWLLDVVFSLEHEKITKQTKTAQKIPTAAHKSRRSRGSQGASKNLHDSKTIQIVSFVTKAAKGARSYI